MNDPFRYVKIAFARRRGRVEPGMRDPMKQRRIPTRRSDHAARRTSIGPRRNPHSANAILDAAEAILNEAGHAGFSIEAVARRAGAGKPTIYKWWPSKAALLLDVYDRRKLDLCDPDTGSLEGDLVALVRDIWRFWRETAAGAVFRSVIAEAQSNPETLGPLALYAEERRDHIASFLERARRRGEVRADADTAAFTDLFSGYLWVRLLTGRIDDDPAAIRAAVRNLIHGLAAVVA